MLLKKRIQKYNSLFFYFLCFLLIFIISINMNYNADEYNYSFIAWTQNRITSISDIIESQKILYMNWTGRILVHFLIQLFLFISPYFYAIFNALIFTAFIYLILDLSACNNSYLKMSFAFFIIFLLIPVFGETCIWLSGSINYLWPSTLFLLLIKLTKDSKAKPFLVILIAFLAGFTQEIVLIGGFLYLGYEVLINKFNKRYLVIFISFIIGGLILISSPGNFIRASSSNVITKTKICQTILGCIIFITALTANFSCYLQNLIKYFKNSKLTKIIKLISLTLFIISLAGIFTQKALSNVGILLLAYEYKYILSIFFLYLLVLFKAIDKEVEYNIILESINYFSIGLTTSLAMGVMPEFPTRSLFLSAVFIIIAILKLYSSLNLKDTLEINLIFSLLSVTILVFSLKYYVFNLRAWNNRFNNSFSNIEDTNLITVEIQPKVPFIIKNHYRCEPSQITNTPHSITNYYCVVYYGVENVIGVRKDHATIKIEKDNLNAADLSFIYTDKDGQEVTVLAEKTLIEPSRSINANKEAYFSIPLNAKNVQFINNGLIPITSSDIQTYTLK